MSCAGNGYLTGNQLTAFPFEDGQCLPWDAGADRAEAQLAIQKCFVDAGVNLARTAVPADGWPSIGAFSARGHTLSFVLTACGVDVALSVSASDAAFPIVSGSSAWGWYVLVLSSEGIREFCESGFAPPATDSSSADGRVGDSWLRLCAKCLSQKPAELTSIRVYDGVSPKSAGPHFVLTGDVAVRPGNNMLLSEPDGENGIALGAVAGAGMGVVACACAQEATAKSPLIGSDGHTRFFNDTCYDIEPSIVTKDGKRVGHLQIHAKCTACCTCAMYESLVNDRLAPLSKLIRQVRTDLKGLLATYEDAVKRFNRRLSIPTLSDVTLSLSGMPVGGNLGSRLSGSNVKGRMGRCAFTAIVRNASYATLSANVYALTGSDTVVEASASWSDEDGSQKSKTGDSSGSVVGQAFTIYPGRSLVITFVSRKDDLVEAVDTGGYSGSISVGLSYRTEDGASGSLGILKRSVEV